MNDVSTRLPRGACRYRTTDGALIAGNLKRPVQGGRSILRAGFVLETLLVSLVLGLMIGLPTVWH